MVDEVSIREPMVVSIRESLVDNVHKRVNGDSVHKSQWWAASIKTANGRQCPEDSQWQTSCRYESQWQTQYLHESQWQTLSIRANGSVHKRANAGQAKCPQESQIGWCP